MEPSLDFASILITSQLKLKSWKSSDPNSTTSKILLETNSGLWVTSHSSISTLLNSSTTSNLYSPASTRTSASGGELDTTSKNFPKSRLTINEKMQFMDLSCLLRLQ